MVSTSLSHPAAGPPGVQNEKCILYKYTKTDKSTSTGERLRLAKTYKCYKKKRLLDRQPLRYACGVPKPGLAERSGTERFMTNSLFNIQC